MLEHDLDISRGDTIIGLENLPGMSSDLQAKVCWLNPRPLQRAKKYFLKHTTQTVQAIVTAIENRIDVSTFGTSAMISRATVTVRRCEGAASGDVIFVAGRSNDHTRFFPSTEIVPVSGRSSAPIRLSSVLLPLPDGPVSEANSPGASRREASTSARILPPSNALPTTSTATSTPPLTGAAPSSSA